jgi:hypothetical protein
MASEDLLPTTTKVRLCGLCSLLARLIFSFSGLRYCFLSFVCPPGVWAFDAAASDPSTTLQLVLPKRDLKKRNPAGCKLNEDDRELLVTVRDGVFSVDVASIGSTGVSSSSPPPPPPLTPDKKQSIRFVDLLRLCGMSKSSHLREAAPLPHPFLSGSFVFVGKEAGSNPGGKFYIVERKKTTTTTTEKQQKRRNLKEQHSHQHHASEHHVVHVSKHHASQHSEQHSTQHSASQHSQHRAQQHTPSQPPKAHEATTHPQKLLPDGHKYECKKLAGSGVYGWQDGDGSVARFTRPHSISIRPGSADVLATDIDNRIVRLVRTGHGAGGHVSTVSYADGAHLFRSLWDPPAAGSSNSSSSGGGEEYNRRSSMEAPDWKRVWRSDQSSAGEAKQMMTASEARRDCESRNLGLCSLSSLRRNQGVGGGGGGGGGGTALEAVWTSDRCRSCWLHWPGTCPTVAAGKDDKIRALEGSHWGKGMQMMAFTRGSGADRFQLQTECMNAAKSVPASPVCCSR